MSLQTEVAALLSTRNVTRINVTAGGIHIAPSDYAAVKSKVQGGQIRVVRRAGLGNGVAKYRYTHNTLIVGFATLGGNADREALVVHECTHAACDIRSTHLTVGNAEAVAFIAQCLFFYYKNERALSRPGVHPTFANPILRAAWAAATTARRTPVLSATDIQPVLTALGGNRLYHGRLSNTESYDGV